MSPVAAAWLIALGCAIALGLFSAHGVQVLGVRRNVEMNCDVFLTLWVVFGLCWFLVIGGLLQIAVQAHFGGAA